MYTLSYFKEKATQRLTAEEIKELIIDLKISLADKKPAFRRLQKNGKFYTYFNKLGVMLPQTEEIINCPDVTYKRELVFNDWEASKIEKQLTTKLAYMLNLKVFNNGKLYADSKTKIREYLTQ
jgi:hypothetical protein